MQIFEAINSVKKELFYRLCSGVCLREFPTMKEPEMHPQSVVTECISGKALGKNGISANS